MAGVAFHSDRVDGSSGWVGDLGDRGFRERESCLSDGFFNPAGATHFQGFVNGVQEQFLRGRVVVGFVLDELFKAGRDIGDAQSPEFLVVNTGKHDPVHPRSW